MGVSSQLLIGKIELVSQFQLRLLHILFIIIHLEKKQECTSCILSKCQISQQNISSLACHKRLTEKRNALGDVFVLIIFAAHLYLSRRVKIYLNIT